MTAARDPASVAGIFSPTEGSGPAGAPAFVVDVSIAAAWFMPDERREATDALLAKLRTASGLAPTLFWFEARNLFLMGERRGRLRSGEAIVSMGQLRALPLHDAGSGDDAVALMLAIKHDLTAYDALYLGLAISEALPLATLDRKLAVAAQAEGVAIVGPLAGTV
jgi:predicted nucleic acid-binding protein